MNENMISGKIKMWKLVNEYSYNIEKNIQIADWINETIRLLYRSVFQLSVSISAE